MATKTPTPIREDQDEVALVVRRLEVAIEGLPQAVEIKTRDQYEEAGYRLSDVKGQAKELKAEKDKILKPLNEAVKRVRDLFAMPEQRLTAIENGIKNGMLAYDREQENQRRLAEARAREEQAAVQKKAEEKAERLRAQGREERAEAVLDAVPSIPVMVADQPKVDGISRRTTYRAVVTNVHQLADWAMENNCFESYFKVDQAALDAAARSMKKAMRYPGVRVEEVMNIAARAS